MAVTRGMSASAITIAAASIVAKVYRDRLMDEMDQVYPGYGFMQHKGYGTSEHIRALRENGPCPEHRRSFAPVARALAANIGSAAGIANTAGTANTASNANTLSAR